MRLNRAWIVASVTTLAVAALAAAGGSADHQYIGATKCKTCHNTAKKGNIYDKWLKTAHAGAYATLASDAAKKIAAGKGIADPQKASECLGCHVTGHGVKAELLGEKYDVSEGISCESCHGPGGDYWKMATMKDLATGKIKPETVGFVMPDSTTCVRCHNDKSPTFKGFKFTEMFAKIAHPVPPE